MMHEILTELALRHLQAAFLNGTGLESRENVRGIWNQMTDRDCQAVRCVATIEQPSCTLNRQPEW